MSDPRLPASSTRAASPTPSLLTMPLKLAEKQKVLEILDVRKRLEHILVAIEGEMDVLQIEEAYPRRRSKRRWRRASASTTRRDEQMKAISRVARQRWTKGEPLRFTVAR